MASPASTVHVSSVIVASLFVTMSAAAGSNATASTNATAMALRGSTDKALPSAARNGTYTCYLCHKSSSVMIRRCPIAQDDCHLACEHADDCYVMKVYPDGSWVVVDVDSCKAATAACYLRCGNGDEHAGDDGAAAGTTTPAAARAQLPHGLPEFQRCGDHLTARGAAAVGDV
ncbi:unnamed protein product [Urochloa decumbens]|uniref:Uncharacterized protein n=1 Tax=Urochloa decumbens TaxID=240449 RepID=A0ABC8XCI3_9POAL